MNRTWRAISALAVIGLFTPVVAGSEPDRFDRFFGRVKPLLASRCASCHGKDKQKGDLRLDSAEGLARGGEGGPALDPANPAESLLLKAVRHDEGVSAMPPKEHLKDDEVADLAAWVRDGAAWLEPARVLVEDESEILDAFSGSGSARVSSDEPRSGTSALFVSGQKEAARVSGWDFPIRERPKAGEYRFVRFSWKKRGGGAAMMELARDGGWRRQGEMNAAWVAGPNSTGRASIPVADEAPADWAVVTRDLWLDGGSWGEWSVTGLRISSIDGGEVMLDSVILGRTAEELDAYKPGRGLAASIPARKARIGDAWSDATNPIRSIFRGERLDLWSLRKPARPPLPEVRQADNVRSPVDRFVLAKLDAAGLAPSAEADRRTLIRRATFDITGLPPTPESVDAFLRDDAADAYERLVDRLLTSPRFGERWGRSWLDVVRYADTNGFERDEFRPNMWRYRDYVIRSFNADKPFDRFVLEQLAGDELAAGPIQSPQDVDRLAATGYLRLGTFDSTTSLFTEDAKGRDELMGDLANTTGSAFLGLTMSCCQCHDHKYDPLSQADHYRLRAFFAAVKPKDDEVVSLPAERRAIEAHNAEVQGRLDAAESIRNGLVDPARGKLKAEKMAALPEEVRKLLDIPRDKRDEATKAKLKPIREQLKVEEKDILAALSEADRKRADELAARIEAIRKEKEAPSTARVVTEAGPSAPPTRISHQGDYSHPLEEVVPGFPSALDPNPAAIAPPPSATTGRRLALARWLASRDNPWTARVIVNRIWQGYFGRGLVATPNDFGYAGSRPSHPELLDWLAVELMDHGWSLKHIHRLIATSATYRLKSTDDPACRAVDPENHLIWRQDARRLDAEAIRDSLLAVSGRLLPVDSGPPRWPHVDDDILEAQPAIYEARHGGDGGRMQDWYADPVDLVDVRSVFLIQKRSVPVPLLAPFDLPDTTTSCARRPATTVAPQALTLFNNPEAVRLARAFADRVAEGAGPDAKDRVRLAFRLALGREPDADESLMTVGLIQRQSAGYAKILDPEAAGRRALVDACRALLNVNEFLFLD